MGERRRIALALAIVLVALVFPPAAIASWSTVSVVRSKSEPFFACPPDGAQLECQRIVDPPIAEPVRGPVAAGAITLGPVAEVSPALSGSGVGGGYSPADLRSAYDFPSTSAGSGQTVAIVDAYDDPDAEANLATYRSEYYLGECTVANGCFRKVNQSGGTSYPQPNEGWAGEIALDLDMVSAVCPKCHLLLVEGNSNTRENLADAENEAAALGASEISNSFGGEGLSSRFASSYDHPGVPTTAAGGDAGFGAEFPSDTPNLIAVGGTTLTRSSGARGWEETVWYHQNAKGEWRGTGSGCSEEPKPAWQLDEGCQYRTANDVAAVADPNTPVSMYDDYGDEPGWLDAGGTSASTPIMAAAMALSNSYTKSLPGAEALYVEAALNGTGALDDIVSGHNGSCGSYLCEAGPAYDGPTGLGSPYGAPDAMPFAAAVTEAASMVTQTSATLNATVDPEGEQVSQCTFEYGISESYGSIASCSQSPGSGPSAVPVSGSATGLAANTTYHFRIVATSAGGTGYGSDETFTTLPEPPTVVSGAASSLGEASATLSATVDPNGGSVSDCHFDYGTTEAYGSSVACSASAGSGTSPVAVSALVAGLSSSTTYHYRIVATNPGGTSYGSDQSFTTPSQALPEIGECVGVNVSARYKDSGCTQVSAGGDTGSYEWQPWPTAYDRFDSNSSAPRLETVGKARVTCGLASVSGEYTGPQTAAIAITFTECDSAALGGRCQSEGASAGEVRAYPLEARLGFIKRGAKPSVGWDLQPVSGQDLADFHCGPTGTSLAGSVIASLLKIDKPTGYLTVKLKASKGRQKPESFAGLPRDVLSLLTPGGQEQAGLTMKISIAAGSGFEIKAIP